MLMGKYGAPQSESRSKRKADEHSSGSGPVQRSRNAVAAGLDLSGMRNVFRRAANPFPARPAAKAVARVPHGFVLQLLPPPDQRSWQAGAVAASRKSHRQRDQLLSQQGADRALSQAHPRRTDSQEAGGARPLCAHLERGL